MITKKMLCEAIISKFVYDNKLLNKYNQYLNYKNEEDTKLLVSHIAESTRFGIALVELGVITKEKYPKEYDYLSNRSGILIEHYDGEARKNSFLTLRELLNMLPNSLEEKPNTDINGMNSMFPLDGPPYY